MTLNKCLINVTKLRKLAILNSRETSVKRARSRCKIFTLPRRTSCILALENASLQRVARRTARARTGRHVCTRKCVVHIYVCVHEDTFETRMVTVFDHPSSRNDCNPSIRPPKPIYQTQVELAVLFL